MEWEEEEEEEPCWLHMRHAALRSGKTGRNRAPSSPVTGAMFFGQTDDSERTMCFDVKHRQQQEEEEEDEEEEDTGNVTDEI
ncbi:hypothetical protein EYF80_006364 [Liparis tanakae]|uniref:Uncharacterized protein n=1 Tax=Liparis tanakae TaxID=230148 RepID=A0A4Z2J1Q5_9TELE|nr:hypothetical protein EYF80_006364 [Liparis tanakae]